MAGTGVQVVCLFARFRPKKSLATVPRSPFVDSLRLDDAPKSVRMKELEKENTRLKRLVAELSLEKQVLKDVASGNF
jgi:hypothetical protein